MTIIGLLIWIVLIGAAILMALMTVAGAALKKHEDCDDPRRFD